MVGAGKCHRTGLAFYLQGDKKTRRQESPSGSVRRRCTGLPDSDRAHLSDEDKGTRADDNRQRGDHDSIDVHTDTYSGNDTDRSCASEAGTVTEIRPLPIIIRAEI